MRSIFFVPMCLFSVLLTACGDSDTPSQSTQEEINMIEVCGSREFAYGKDKLDDECKKILEEYRKNGHDESSK